jgi:acyl carrier protein
MDKRLSAIFLQISGQHQVLHSAQQLKKDLLFDSLKLVELSVKIYQEFGIDLGECFDRGNPLETVGDIEKCLR